MASDIKALLARVAGEHPEHVGAGGGIFWAECIGRDCTWSDHSDGNMRDGLDAHRAHVAAVQAAALREWLTSKPVAQVVVEVLPGAMEPRNWNYRSVAYAALGALADAIGGDQ